MMFVIKVEAPDGMVNVYHTKQVAIGEDDRIHFECEEGNFQIPQSWVIDIWLE